MKPINEEEIETINNFADFCKQKSLRVTFKSDGRYRVEQIKSVD